MQAMSTDKKLSLLFIIFSSFIVSGFLFLLINWVIYMYASTKIFTLEDCMLLTCCYTFIGTHVISIVLFSMEFIRLTMDAKLIIMSLVLISAGLLAMVLFHVEWVIETAGCESLKLVPVRRWMTLLGYHLICGFLILGISICWKLYKQEIQAIVANENQPLPHPAVQPQQVLPDHAVIQIGPHRHGQGGDMSPPPLIN